MTDGNFTGIMVFDVNQPFYNTHSFRVATETQVLNSYKNIHKYLTDLRRQNNLVAENTLRHGEFREILASFLICLAHSEPSKHNSYNQTFPATLNDIDVTISFCEIVKRLTVTPLQFLSAHADTVYALGKSRGIEFEFGKLHGLHLTGVGFIAFPFANSDSKTDKVAFNKMLNDNEHVRKYYFDGKLW